MPKTIERHTERPAKTPDQALQALMRLCSRAEKSSGDALRLMRMWKVAPELRGAVVAELERLRFIDDDRYAGAFVREKSGLDGWGAYKIRRALAAKGISPERIERALATIDATAAAARLRQRLERKATSLTCGTWRERRGKLMRYGLALGYDYDCVASAVEELIREEE